MHKKAGDRCNLEIKELTSRRETQAQEIDEHWAYTGQMQAERDAFRDETKKLNELKVSS